MSTISTNPTLGLAAAAAPQAGSPVLSPDYPTHSSRPALSAESDEALVGGLTPSAWLKIGIIALLMAVLFHNNLSRLWLKTNPFTGQPNWGHAFFIPLIGLYYLFVNRRELVNPSPAPKIQGSLFMAWALLSAVWAVVVALLFAAIPNSLYYAGVVLDAIGLLKNYHNWPLSPVYPILLGSVVLAGWFIHARRRFDKGQHIADWAARLWPHLLAWGMLVLTAWGAGFFVVVVAGSLFPKALLTIKVALAALGLLSLAAVVFSEGNDSGVSARPLDAAAAWVANRSALWFGGFVLAWGILFSLWGIYPGKNDFFKDVGMVVALFGVVLLLGGWGVMRTAWFPVLFLFCALPWPDQVYSWLAGPLQHLAATVATRVLTMFGVPSQVAGTKIIMNADPGSPPRILNVAEACAGLRSLMTFVSVAAAWAFLFMASRPLWHRLVLVASAIPVAITCNVMRVSGQGLLDHFISRQLSEGFAHQFAGLVMLIPAFFMILLVGWILDHLFIEEADETPVVRGAAGTTPAAAGAPFAATVASAPAAAKPALKAGAANAGKVLVVPRSTGATAGAAGAVTAPAAKPKAAPAAPAGAPATPAPKAAAAPQQAGAKAAAKPVSRPASAAPPAGAAPAQPASGAGAAKAAPPQAPQPAPQVRRPLAGQTGQAAPAAGPAAKAPPRAPVKAPNAGRPAPGAPSGAPGAPRGAQPTNTPNTPNTPNTTDKTDTTETTEGL